jgi:hypothetical protein
VPTIVLSLLVLTFALLTLVIGSGLVYLTFVHPSVAVPLTVAATGVTLVLTVFGTLITLITTLQKGSRTAGPAASRRG